MSTIQEIVSTNYLFEDKTPFDPSWLKGKDYSQSVSSFHKNQSSFVVAIAEIVHCVAEGALLSIIGIYSREALMNSLSIQVFLKLLSPKSYEKEDIEKFKQRKTYLEYFKAKAELVACLSAKQQGLLLLNECFSKTWRKVACAAFISLAPQNVLFVRPGNVIGVRDLLHRVCFPLTALIISYSNLHRVFKDVLDVAEAHLHVIINDLVTKNQAQLT